MSTVGIPLFVIAFLLAVVTPFVLYYLVRTEHTQRTTMDRETAERAARRDTHDRDEQ